MSEAPPTGPEVPFAQPTDLPVKYRDHADAFSKLEDASQVIIDEFPAATVARANPATLRRIVCAMVVRVLDSEDSPSGLDTTQFGVGPFQESYKWSNPNGDLYLTKRERFQVKGGVRAGVIDPLAHLAEGAQ